MTTTNMIRNTKTLARAAAAALALAILPVQGAAAQVVAQAACTTIVGGCDRVDFAFNSAGSGEFFSIVIRSSDPDFRFVSDNTDPVGGGAFQMALLDDVDNGELLIFPGYVDPYGSGQQWTTFGAGIPTQLTNNFVLSLYFESWGTLDASTFTFETTALDADGNEFFGSGAVSVADVSAVPEPGTVILLATGLAGIGAVRLRRRREGAIAGA